MCGNRGREAQAGHTLLRSLNLYELKRQSRTRRSPGRQPSNRLFGQSGNGFVIGRLQGIWMCGENRLPEGEGTGVGTQVEFLN